MGAGIKIRLRMDFLSFSSSRYHMMSYSPSSVQILIDLACPVTLNLPFAVEAAEKFFLV